MYSDKTSATHMSYSDPSYGSKNSILSAGMVSVYPCNTLGQDVYNSEWWMNQLSWADGNPVIAFPYTGPTFTNMV